MAKIVIAGDAVVVTSSLKLDDIRKVEKYRPEALILKGGEDNKEPIFAVQTAKSGNGSINQYGVTFASESHDENKFAQITMTLGTVNGDVKEHVADKLGAAVDMLNQIEGTIPDVIEAIDAKKKAIIENIAVAQ